MSRRLIMGLVLLLVGGCGGAIEGGDVYSEVSPGLTHTCARTDKGQAVCWGGNADFQVGAPADIQAVSYPQFIFAGPLVMEEVSSGATFSCGRLRGGGALCWGGDRPTSAVTLPDVHLLAVSVGTIACGLVTGGEILCWSGPGADPVAVPALTGASEVSAGTFEACAVGSGIGILCWRTPGGATRLVPGTGATTYHGLTSGGTHECAFGTDSVARCWGVNTLGQLGDGTVVGNATPQVVVQGDRPSATELFATLHASGNQTCGVTTTGGGYCWGLGISHPVQTPGITTWSDLRPGALHVCGFALGDDKLYCWGTNDVGQLGNGTFDNSPDPVKVIAP